MFLETACPQDIQREESHPANASSLQKCDALSRIFCRFRHNILKPTPKRDFDRRLVVRICADQLRDHATDPGE